ncbi:MAG: PIN domain-containing protein [Puniceicoccaceae bacterium]
MKVIVDTDVWSEALRKSDASSAYVDELRTLIEEGRVQLIGPVRQEILCGIRDEKQFERIEKSLGSFPDKRIGADIFVMAAKFFNLCRSKGIQGSNTDFLLCACSVAWGFPILTKDKDFQLFRKHIEFELLDPR